MTPKQVVSSRAAAVVVGITAMVGGLPPSHRFKTVTSETALSVVAANAQEVGKMQTQGFRHDPMAWVKTDQSLQGALVRRHVFGRPAEGDEAILKEQIDEILAQQNEDGTLSDDPRHRYQFTAEALNRLAELGVDPERTDVQRAVQVVLRGKDEKSADPIGIYTVRALLALGMANRSEAKKALEHVVASEKEWNGPHAGCPWTPIEHLQTLWQGRHLLDSTKLVGSVLEWIADGMNPAGCLSYKDPWGFLRIASLVDAPVAKRIVRHQVPMILRGQHADGSWGDHTLVVLRALVTHGLLEELRKLPPLPPDWTVARQIPAPKGKLYTLAYDGENLWTRECESDVALCISPTDGSVLKRLKLPEGQNQGLGWWDGGLGVTQSDPKRLVRLDPETGAMTREAPLEKMDWINGFAQVNGELWIADGFQGNVLRFEARSPGEGRPYILAGPCPIGLTAVPDGVWHFDVWAPAMVKTGFEGATPHDGPLLDWAEKPFDGQVNGLAWDGENLWALDAAAGRICAINRTR